MHTDCPARISSNVVVSRWWRSITGLIALATIITGYTVTKGALYGYSIMGLSVGLITTFKDTPLKGAFNIMGGYCTLLIVYILLICFTVLFLSGLLICVCGIIYVSLWQEPRGDFVKYVSIAFLCTGLGMTLGISVSLSEASRGAIATSNAINTVEVYFYLWPVLFAAIAVLYGVIARKLISKVEKLTA